MNNKKPGNFKVLKNFIWCPWNEKFRIFRSPLFTWQTFSLRQIWSSKRFELVIYSGTFLKKSEKVRNQTRESSFLTSFSQYETFTFLTFQITLKILVHSDRSQLFAHLVDLKEAQRAELSEERKRFEFIELSDEFQCAMAALVDVDE